MKHYAYHPRKLEFNEKTIWIFYSAYSSNFVTFWPKKRTMYKAMSVIGR